MRVDIEITFTKRERKAYKWLGMRLFKKFYLQQNRRLYASIRGVGQKYRPFYPDIRANLNPWILPRLRQFFIKVVSTHITPLAAAWLNKNTITNAYNETEWYFVLNKKWGYHYLYVPQWFYQSVEAYNLREWIKARNEFYSNHFEIND